MIVVVGVFIFAALLAGITVTVLLAIASLLEIVPPLFARGREGIDNPAAGALQPPEGKAAARSRIRFIH